jgi:hypothetical protein
LKKDIKMREKLTAAFCEKTKKPGVFADGGNLYLEVKNDGRKYWCFRWRDRDSKYTTGKSAGISRLRQKGLGPYGKYDVTLKEARILAGECRRMLRNNTDPATEARHKAQEATIKAENTLTFKECSDRYYKAHKAGWGDRHTDEWRT